LIINTLQKTLLVESRNKARYSQTCRFSQRSVRINWRQSAQWAALSLTTPMRATSAGHASKRSEQLWRSRDSDETKSHHTPNVRPVALIPILLIRGILETWTSLLRANHKRRCAEVHTKTLAPDSDRFVLAQVN